MSQDPPAGSDKDDWTTSTRKEFYDYYAEQSNSESTRQRFRSQKDRILKVHGENGPGRSLDVGDIGGGAGSLSMIWAEGGHRVRCVDINAHLIELARKRSVERGLDITFEVASATDLPWQDQSLDVCCMPELLEHVEDWKRCLDEMARVLRPGGILFLSTSNKLCPKQQEFALPLYSWYPGRLKAHYVRLANTTRPELANYATYPAVNWFTPYSLRAALLSRGFDRILDNFDLAALGNLGTAKTLVLSLIRSNPIFRCFGYLLYPGTVLLAQKTRGCP